MARGLRHLSSRHQAAITMRLAGESAAAIARKLGVQRRTVYLWFSDPRVKRELAERTHDVNTLIAGKLTDNALAGLELLRRFADQGEDQPATPELRLEAIRELLERHPLTRAQAVEERLDGYSATFAAMSDEQLALFIRRWSAGEIASQGQPITLEGRSVEAEGSRAV